ncbi:MAG: sirohydrochlorin chelatase, partial [Sporichthyaceae bacterium]
VEGRDTTPKTGVLLLAHGSRDPRHAATMRRIELATLACAGLPVRIAYLDHHGPSTADAALQLVADGAPSVTVLPLLLSEAFHRKVDVPAAVLAAQSAVGVRVRLAAALGPDPVLLDAAHQRLREAGGGGRDAGVVLAYAGTTDDSAAAAVTRLARAWQSRWHVPVRVAHAGSTGPDLADAVEDLRACGTERVEVASWFLAPGRLSTHVEREAARSGAAVVAAPLGDSPEVVAAILDRAGVRRTVNAA